ncbi:flagellar protein FlaG [Lachnospiraceae bacterium MD1]|uniref:Flagellar protein FlaG n=1 Tax=Variimorphobacter saccharofermentans TaxID=2755051 RepID=A0A839K564_9FIRM|nr:flagellar protein FlaG [Variimorphobacter saccharofermentans]MBB2184199.1 flagellar protein FlaG [Variimorphobacter saccharofermentans]
MALNSLSGAGHQNSAKPIQSSVVETNAQAMASKDLSITEVATENKHIRIEKNRGMKEVIASEQQIRDAITRANNKMKAHRTRCEFAYHEETNRVTIKVYDRETEEVLREIPPEESLEVLEKIWELAGLLVDERR